MTKTMTQKGWDEWHNFNGEMYYHKRGITNGIVVVVRTGDQKGWFGIFTHENDEEQNFIHEKVFPDTFTGIIEAKIAIATWHANTYTRTWYETSRLVYRGGKKSRSRGALENDAARTIQ